MNYEIQTTSYEIEQGAGFKDVMTWFVDCDGWSFGSFESEDDAKRRADELRLELSTKTPREAYYSQHGH